ncbi:hypothetical protein D3C72_425910 [compost metagenome]
MQLGALGLGQQRVGRGPDAIVKEADVAVVAVDQPLALGRVEQPPGLVWRSRRHRGQGRQLHLIAEGGHDVEQPLGLGGQAPDGAAHQLADVVGVALGLDLGEVPAPAARLEGDQALLVERGQELQREERIALGLLVDQRGQRPGRRAVVMHQVGHQLPDVAGRERPERDRAQGGAGVANRADGRQQGVAGVDLVGAVRADDHQVAGLGMREEVLKQTQARGIRPLHVVPEQDHRVIEPGELAQKPPNDVTEPALELQRRQGRRDRLGPEQDAQARHHVHDELRVLAQGPAEPVLPIGDARFALGEELLHQAVEHLRDDGVRARAAERVELARGEVSPVLQEHRKELAHHPRLADARVAGDEHQRRRARRGDVLVGLNQRRDLLLAIVELLRQHEPVRDVAGPQRQGPDAALGEPLGPGGLQVVKQPAGGLVAVVGELGEQLEGDRPDRLRQIGPQRGRRHGLFGDVAVEPAQHVLALARQPPGEHLVEHHPQRVEVAADVDGPAGAAGLLGREKGQRALDAGRGLHRAIRAREAGREAVARQPHVEGLGVDQDVGGPQIAVDHAAVVLADERARDADGDREGPLDRHRPPQQPLERHAGKVRQHQPPRLKLEGLEGPGRVEQLGELPLMREALERAGRGQIRSDGADERPPARPLHPVQSRVGLFEERLDHAVVQQRVHGPPIPSGPPTGRPSEL